MMEWRDRLMMTAPNRYALTTPQEYSDRIDAWLTALSQFEETYGTWGYKTTTRQEIVDSALTIRQTRIAEMDAKEEYIRQVRIAREGDIGMEFELHGRQYRKAGHAYTGLSRCSWSSGEVDMATAVMKVPVIDLSSNRQHVLEL
jgi:hypothetical protein